MDIGDLDRDILRLGQMGEGQRRDDGKKNSFHKKSLVKCSSDSATIQTIRQHSRTVNSQRSEYGGARQA